MRKKDFDWGDFYDDSGEWLADRPVKKRHQLGRVKKFLLQIGAAVLLFGCFYGLRATGTMVGDMADRAAFYSVSHNVQLGELKAAAEPYLSRFAEVEIFQGVQTVTSKVMRPMPLVERPVDWIPGEFDGERRSYVLSGGEAIKSIGSGRVIDVITADGGQTLIMQYGHNIEAEYAGIDEVYVKKGERVRIGQTLGIGALMENGRSGEFSLLILDNGRAVDAETMFNAE